MPLDKIQVARRQLGTALALFIEDLDPISVHTLACAGGEIAEQIEQRLKLGLGRPDLVFTSPLGEMINPDYLTDAFVKKVAGAGVKPITFHGCAIPISPCC
jgi:hypothetical protein